MRAKSIISTLILVLFLVSTIQARYYDPSVGRFMSPDTIVPNTKNPQSLNRYSYVENNPIIMTDPDGHNPLAVAIVVGAAIGAASGGTQGQLFNRHAWNNFNWEMATIGAVGGAVGGATAFGVASGLGATGFGSMGLAGDIAIGGLAGGAAGGTGYATPTIISGSQWNWNSFGQSVGFGTALGGVSGGLFSKNLKPFLKGQQTFFGNAFEASILPPKIAETFRDGKYKHIKLKTDVDAHRFWSMKDGQRHGVDMQGRYLTTKQSLRHIHSSADARKLLDLPIENLATDLATFKIPKGSDVYIGRIEGGGSSITQIYIKNGNDLIYIKNEFFNPPISIRK